MRKLNDKIITWSGWERARTFWGRIVVAAAVGEEHKFFISHLKRKLESLMFSRTKLFAFSISQNNAQHASHIKCECTQMWLRKFTLAFFMSSFPPWNFRIFIVEWSQNCRIYLFSYYSTLIYLFSMWLLLACVVKSVGCDGGRAAEVKIA